MNPSHLSKAAFAALQCASAQGNAGMIARLACGRAALPSIEEFEAELGCNFLQQERGVVVVRCPHDRAAGCALYEEYAELVPRDALGLLQLEAGA